MNWTKLIYTIKLGLDVVLLNFWLTNLRATSKPEYLALTVMVFAAMLIDFCLISHN